MFILKKGHQPGVYVPLRALFLVLYVLCFTRPRYQVSVYRTISPLVYQIHFIFAGNDDMHESSEEFVICPDPTTDC